MCALFQVHHSLVSTSVMVVRPQCQLMYTSGCAGARFQAHFPSGWTGTMCCSRLHLHRLFGLSERTLNATKRVFYPYERRSEAAVSWVLACWYWGHS